MLELFVGLYLLISVSIGLYAAMRVKNSSDYVLAGRSLPIYITIATVFATWFGSEAVLGIPSTFIEEGLGGIVADPFGAGMCLIFVGMFFAARLYRMKLMTIGDFYRIRYGKSVELFVSIAICISYLGWVAAQIVALGLVINLVSGEAVSFEFGMAIGLSLVVAYTVLGGMWSVAMTDFVQMVVIVIGLAAVAYVVAGRFDGGAMEVITHAAANDKFDFWPAMDAVSIDGVYRRRLSRSRSALFRNKTCFNGSCRRRMKKPRCAAPSLAACCIWCFALSRFSSFTVRPCLTPPWWSGIWARAAIHSASCLNLSSMTCRW